MNRVVLFILLAASLAITNCKSGQSDSSSPLPQPPQSKVLIRTVDTGTLAVDGLLWLVDMHLASEKSAAKDSLRLSQTTGMSVQEEHVNEIRGPGQEKQDKKPREWKLDPKNFDFLLNVTRDYQEHTKTSFSAPLQITVKETWNLEKVPDPSITNTWNLTYTLNGGSAIASFEKTAADQTEQIVVPARGPVLQEIRAFIEKNSNK